MCRKYGLTPIAPSITNKQTNGGISPPTCSDFGLTHMMIRYEIYESDMKSTSWPYQDKQVWSLERGHRCSGNIPRILRSGTNSDILILWSTKSGI